MTNNERIKILISTHKEFDFPKNDLYLPIHAGKSISAINLNYQGDNTGENISLKNNNYCELTSIYWAWKNLNDFDFIGICHYRRFFLFNKYLKHFSNNLIFNTNEFFKLQSVFSIDKKILGQYDFILAEPRDLGKSIYDDYAFFCNKEDFDILGDVIKVIEPEYFDSYLKLFHFSSKLSPYNMFITNHKNLDKYCDWLFSILFEVERRIQINSDIYQSRVFGFMAERLLNLYIFHNRFSVKYLPVIKVDNEESMQLGAISKLKKSITRIIDVLITQ
jgi:hypothetical protein